jgi:hypothetical protein
MLISRTGLRKMIYRIEESIVKLHADNTADVDFFQYTDGCDRNDQDGLFSLIDEICTSHEMASMSANLTH